MYRCTFFQLVRAQRVDLRPREYWVYFVMVDVRVAYIKITEIRVGERIQDEVGLF